VDPAIRWTALYVRVRFECGYTRECDSYVWLLSITSHFVVEEAERGDCQATVTQIASRVLCSSTNSRSRNAYKGFVRRLEVRHGGVVEVSTHRVRDESNMARSRDARMPRDKTPRVTIKVEHVCSSTLELDRSSKFPATRQRDPVSALRYQMNANAST